MNRPALSPLDTAYFCCQVLDPNFSRSDLGNRLMADVLGCFTSFLITYDSETPAILAVLYWDT